jgi:18S rRNA (guanine1575-N7)-methyltransferase
MFDACISISAVQWLCNADKSWHNPHKRLSRFFETLYMVLAKGARAVLQFYPENARQMELITSCAIKAGFAGGLVVDYPNSTRAKKYYLVLTAGAATADLPAAKTEQDSLGGDLESVPGGPPAQRSTVTHYDQLRRKREREMRLENRRSARREPVKSRNWVLQKKAAQRAKGIDVRPDSKYTARKRKDRF